MASSGRAAGSVMVSQPQALGQGGGPERWAGGEPEEGLGHCSGPENPHFYI